MRAVLASIATWPIRQVRRYLRSRPIRFTRFGWFYTLFTIATGAAAINTGNNLLYLILGLLLGSILISGFLSDSGLWRLNVSFHPRGDLFAGEATDWDVELSKGWFPAITTHVVARWRGHADTDQLFVWIPSHGRRSQVLELTPVRRGRISVRAVRFSSAFPFGLFEKYHEYPFEGDGWIVYPSIRHTGALRILGHGPWPALEPENRRGPGSSPFDVRPYQAGDPARRIDWKGSARRGSWIVKEMERESEAAHLWSIPAWPSGSQLEDFLSFVASLVYEAYAGGRRIGLRMPGANYLPDHSPAHLRQILTALALVEPGNPATTPARPGELDLVTLWRAA